MSKMNPREGIDGGHTTGDRPTTRSFTDTSTMNRFKYLFLLFNGWMLVFSLVGCQPKKSILLEGNPCQVPCWHNIRPGITSGEEFVQIASKLPFIDYPPKATPQIYESAFSYSGWILIRISVRKALMSGLRIIRLHLLDSLSKIISKWLISLKFMGNPNILQLFQAEPR